MLKRRQKAEGRRQKHPDPDCGRRNGETTAAPHGHGWRDGEVEFKYLTVRDLIMAWAVTAWDFQDARLARWTGWMNRQAFKTKQRLNMSKRSQQRACSAIRFWVARATGRCRRVPVPRRSADIPVCGCWGLSSPQFLIAKNIAELESSANPQAGKPALPLAASPFRSAGRRPARAGRPCPFSHSTHSTTNYYIKSCQISHCEKFEESRVIMSRIGKIARLPLDIREQLNRRLQDGEIGKDLVVWLNSVPDVQAVLKAEFGDRPVHEPNLSDWRAGGYEDWRVHQDTMQQVNQLVANAKELGGASQTPLSELLATCLAARYAVELSRLTTTKTPREGTRPTAEAEGDKGCDLEGRKSRLKAAFPEREADGNEGCDFEVLRKLCRDVLALRRLDLAAQRLRIEREAADREMRKDEEERKEKVLQAERNHRMLKRARQATRAAGYHLPFDPRFDDEADMQKEVAVAELRRERDKLAAVHDKMKKDFERQQEYDQELEELEQAEEEKLAREGKTAKEEP